MTGNFELSPVSFAGDVVCNVKSLFIASVNNGSLLLVLTLSATAKFVKSSLAILL